MTGMEAIHRAIEPMELKAFEVLDDLRVIQAALEDVDHWLMAELERRIEE